MNNQEKAERYDSLVREGHSIQYQISKLKSESINNESVANVQMLAELNKKLAWLEQETTRLVNG
jgi:hypothetical protein